VGFGGFFPGWAVEGVGFVGFGGFGGAVYLMEGVGLSRAEAVCDEWLAVGVGWWCTCSA